MPRLNITADLKEGMKIAPINEQEKEYTLIKSSKDNEMYALHQTHILKLNDVPNLDTEFICVNMSSFKEEVSVLETGQSNFYLVDNDFCIYSFIKDELDENDDDFQNINMRIVKMSREKFMLKKGFHYEFGCREIIADEYKKKFDI